MIYLTIRVRDGENILEQTSPFHNGLTLDKFDDGLIKLVNRTVALFFELYEKNSPLEVKLIAKMNWQAVEQ